MRLGHPIPPALARFQISHINSGFFAERDLQLKTSYASLPPNYHNRSESCQLSDDEGDQTDLPFGFLIIELTTLSNFR